MNWTSQRQKSGDEARYNMFYPLERMKKEIKGPWRILSCVREPRHIVLLCRLKDVRTITHAQCCVKSARSMVCSMESKIPPF